MINFAAPSSRLSLGIRNHISRCCFHYSSSKFVTSRTCTERTPLSMILSHDLLHDRQGSGPDPRRLFRNAEQQALVVEHGQWLWGAMITVCFAKKTLFDEADLCSFQADSKTERSLCQAVESVSRRHREDDNFFYSDSHEWMLTPSPALFIPLFVAG